MAVVGRVLTVCSVAEENRATLRKPAVDFLIRSTREGCCAKEIARRASVGRARSRGAVEVVHAVPVQQRLLVRLRRRRPDAPTLPSAATLSFFHVCKPYTDPLCK